MGKKKKNEQTPSLSQRPLPPPAKATPSITEATPFPPKNKHIAGALQRVIFIYRCRICGDLFESEDHWTDYNRGDRNRGTRDGEYQTAIHGDCRENKLLDVLYKGIGDLTGVRYE